MMSEETFLKDLAEPLFFDSDEFGAALDRYRPDNPFMSKDTLESDSRPVVDGGFYDTSIATVMPIDSKSPDDFPDISDEILSDYKFRKMMGEDVPYPKFVDLDTAEDFVQFMKNTADGIYESETEFLPSGTDAAAFQAGRTSEGISEIIELLRGGA